MGDANILSSDKTETCGGFSRGRKVGRMPVPGGHTGGCKGSVHAPAEAGGVSPWQGMVLELFPEICSAVQVNAAKSISLGGADPLVPAVRAECPSGDISSAPAAWLNDLPDIWNSVSVSEFALHYNSQGMKSICLNTCLLALFMFLKLWFQQCKGKSLSFGLVFPWVS